MRNYLDNLNEEESLDSIQDLYLTYTSFIVDFIDKASYDQMLKKVVTDIIENDSIINKIKSIKQKQKMFLGEIIYNWAVVEFHNHFQNSVAVHSRRAHRAINRQGWLEFLEKFKDAFSDKVLKECKYKIYVKSYKIITNYDKNRYNIMLRLSNKWHRIAEVEARMVVKYEEKQNILKICYVEYTGGTWFIDFPPKSIAPELFKGVKKLIDQITKSTGNKPEIFCKEKYKDIYKIAKEKKYLEDEKKNISFN